MPRPERVFAVIPAAGRSRRMGQPKLLLPLGKTTVLRRLLSVLETAAIHDRVVVVRRDDDDVRREAERAGARVVCPEVDPPDMRTSVEHALERIREIHKPAATDGWLLVPADHPLIDAAVLDALVARFFAESDPIIAPTYQGRRGHPTLFRWSLAEEMAAIPRDQGPNALVERYGTRVADVPVDSPFILADLDTPADYEALCRAAAIV